MMRRTIMINVTQKDINDGKRGDPYGCPIARALRRKVSAVNLNIGVGMSGARVEVLSFNSDGTSNTRLIATTYLDFSDETQRFRQSFDTHGRLGVEPALLVLIFRETVIHQSVIHP